MRKETNLSYEEIGCRVRALRKDSYYTQIQLGESIRLSKASISEIENGRKGMSLETLSALCKEFQVTTDYLLFGDDSVHWQDTLLHYGPFLDEEEIHKIIAYLYHILELKKQLNVYSLAPE